MRFKPRMKESAKGKIVIFLKFLTQAELCDPYLTQLAGIVGKN